MSDPDWSEIPSLSALRAFEATARYGGFTRAAEALDVSPAAVAQQVRGLETELGVPLVRRAGRGLALTVQGAGLAERLAAAFETLAGGIAELRADEAKRGLRVTAAPILVDDFLLPHMGDFWRRHPGVEVSLIPGPNEVDLARSTFDMAIRASDGKEPGLVATKLVDTRWVVVGAPKLFGKTGFVPARLKWAFVRNLPWQKDLLRRVKLDPETTRTQDLGNLRQLLALVRDGGAVSILTEFSVRGEVAAGKLKIYELPRGPKLAYWALTHSGPQRQVVAQFTAWLQRTFEADPRPVVPKGEPFPRQPKKV